MTDRPILFSAPMVRALLDGRKTQTRRILKLPKWSTGDMKHVELDDDGSPITICKDTGCLSAIPVRFQKGDRLWVKETTKLISVGPSSRFGLAYMADEEVPEVHFFDPVERPKALKLTKQTPSIYMPRWASRLTLTVTDVRVQRLQDISEEDAIAEGATERPNCSGVGDRESGWCMDWSRVGQPSKWATDRKTLQERDVCLATARHAFWNLFDKINDLGTWNANPWVVALTFIVERRNIDTTEAT